MLCVPITDEYEVKTLARLKEGVVEEARHLNPDWLAKNDRIVVPRESACHFDERYARALSIALREEGYERVFALATEPLEINPVCYSVDVSKEGLLAFSHECAHFNFALIPANRSGAILCTVYEYFLIAGSANFVRQAVGGDVEAAWREFEEVSLDPCWEGKLAKIVERYRPFSSQR